MCFLHKSVLGLLKRPLNRLDRYKFERRFFLSNLHVHISSRMIVREKTRSKMPNTPNSLILTYLILFRLIPSYFILSNLILPCHVMSCHVVYYLILGYPFWSCITLSYLSVSYLILSCLTPPTLHYPTTPRRLWNSF